MFFHLRMSPKGRFVGFSQLLKDTFISKEKPNKTHIHYFDFDLKSQCQNLSCFPSHSLERYYTQFAALRLNSIMKTYKLIYSI